MKIYELQISFWSGLGDCGGSVCHSYMGFIS